MANKSSNNKTQKKSAPKGTAKSKKGSFFDEKNRQAAVLVPFFIALILGAVVFINGSSVWGMLRNVIFGVFGISAFVLPFFILFLSVVYALGKESKKFNYKVIEGVILFTLLIAFLQIIKVDESLTFGAQLSEAFNVYKNSVDAGDVIRYGYGFYGAFFGGLALLITGGTKLASGIITLILFLILFMIFTGTTLLKLINSLRTPAEAVSEYAGEKLEDMREGYDAVSENIRQKKEASREAKRSPKKNEFKVPSIENDSVARDEISLPFEDVEVETLQSHKKKVKKENGFAGIPVINEPADTVNGNLDKEYDDLGELFGVSSESASDIRLDSVIEQIDTQPEPETEPAPEPVAEKPARKKSKPEPVSVEEISSEIIETESEIVYRLPPIECLNAPKYNKGRDDSAMLREKGELIVKTLADFNIPVRIVDICKSPSVTRFELQPAPGVKISKITSLTDDLAMNLAASGVRIEAPIPNKNAVGIEVPNSEKTMVTLREIIESETYQKAKSKLNVALGRDIQGEPTCADLAKMPHLLVAGTTGSGKSVCLNTMIMSILYNATPDEVKLIMIDPKKVEFTVYKSVPHLLIPVVADPRKAAGALSWAVAEMDKRYAMFADNGVRNLEGYNQFAKSEGLPKMPQIVIFIDELSDLMMAASNEVEDSICRLAQKARAAGMHLIVATQRPSVDVITGLIKANIPSRIALAVKSQIDSRTIIDTQGAEKLLGNGDMLFCPVGLAKPVRVQGCYVSDEEIENVIDFLKSQGEATYDDNIIQEIEAKAAQDPKKKSNNSDIDTDSIVHDGDDELIEKAIEVVVESGLASTTLLQRKLKLGYARAARIIDELEEKHVIGPFEGSKPRKVLITKDQWYEMQAMSQTSAPKQLTMDDVVNDEPAEEDEPDEIESNSSEPNYFGGATV